MQRGLVSIITPIYNGERYIGQTIESVINQTYPDWEMIIVDDGSRDRSAQIVAGYAAKEPRIHLVSQQNTGSAAARNNGLRRASGQYISLLDADDAWDPIFLESQLNFMREKNALLVYSSHRRIDEDSKEILRPFIVPPTATYNDMVKTSSISCLTGIYNIEHCGKVFLREELKSYRDDLMYWLDILRKVKIGYGNREVIASYRVISTSTTGKKKKLIVPHFMMFYKVEKVGLLKSIYYTLTWAIYGFLKYRK